MIPNPRTAWRFTCSVFLSVISLGLLACGDEFSSPAERDHIRSYLSNVVCLVASGPPGGCPDCLIICADQTGASLDWSVEWTSPEPLALCASKIRVLQGTLDETVEIPGLPMVLSGAGTAQLGSTQVSGLVNDIYSLEEVGTTSAVETCP